MNLDVGVQMRFRFIIMVALASMMCGGCEYETLRGPVDCDQNPVLLELTAVEDSDCALMDGRIVVSASGGSGRYTFLMEGREKQTDSTFENVAAGVYQISAMDENNCSASLEVSVKNRSGMNITFETSDAGCGSTNGSLTVSAFDGTGPYQFRLDDGIFSDANSFDGLHPGTYMLTVKDATGCTLSQPIRINSGISFATSISPIIQKSCVITECHNGSQFPDFRQFKNIHDNAAKIKELTGDRTMPQEGTLTQEQINMIACWVNDGAPDN